MTDYGYKVTDCGSNGKTFERDLKAMFNQKAVVSRQGKIDFRKSHKCFEVKTGAGELDYLLKSKIKYVIYVPVVNPALAISQQEGFVLERTTFLNLLSEIGLIRSKVSTSGQEKVTIQTFWNNKLRKPHGKKYYSLLDKLYEESLLTFEDYINADGIID